MNDKVQDNRRNIAIVGPYSSGKTTLLESILLVTGACTRKGSVKDGNTVGDSSHEARERQMSTEITVAKTNYQDLVLNFLDCPGSIEFSQETYNALVGAGAAIVVCEPVIDRVLTLAPLFKFLDDWEIPHVVFINKMERSEDAYMDLLHALKSISTRAIVPQQYPIRQSNQLLGFIDLVTEQAYHYHKGSSADLVAFPEDLKAEEQAARNEMLETLADFDDHLLEELLEDINPPQEEIIQDLKQDLSADLIVPVFFGVAEQDYGVRPLLNALIKEAPAPSATASRRGLNLAGSTDVIAQVLKTYFTPQGGRLSVVRVWQGELTEGMTLNGVRIGGIYGLFGQQLESLSLAIAGDIVGISRLEGIRTGETLTNSSKGVKQLPTASQVKPVYALAVTPENRQDDVKISGALTNGDGISVWGNPSGDSIVCTYTIATGNNQFQKGEFTVYRR